MSRTWTKNSQKTVKDDYFWTENRLKTPLEPKTQEFHLTSAFHPEIPRNDHFSSVCVVCLSIALGSLPPRIGRCPGSARFPRPLGQIRESPPETPPKSARSAKSQESAIRSGVTDPTSACRRNHHSGQIPSTPPRIKSKSVRNVRNARFVSGCHDRMLGSIPQHDARNTGLYKGSSGQHPISTRSLTRSVK